MNEHDRALKRHDDLVSKVVDRLRYKHRHDLSVIVRPFVLTDYGEHDVVLYRDGVLDVVYEIKGRDGLQGRLKASTQLNRAYRNGFGRNHVYVSQRPGYGIVAHRFLRR